MRKTLATALALTMLGIAPASADLLCSPDETHSEGDNQFAPPGTLVSVSTLSIFKSDGEDPSDLGTNLQNLSASSRRISGEVAT